MSFGFLAKWGCMNTDCMATMMALHDPKVCNRCGVGEMKQIDTRAPYFGAQIMANDQVKSSEVSEEAEDQDDPSDAPSALKEIQDRYDAVRKIDFSDEALDRETIEWGERGLVELEQYLAAYARMDEIDAEEGR